MMVTMQLWDVMIGPLARELSTGVNLVRNGQLMSTLNRTIERTVTWVLREHFADVRNCVDQRDYVRDELTEQAAATNASVGITTRLQADGSIAYGYNLNDQEVT